MKRVICKKSIWYFKEGKLYEIREERKNTCLIGSIYELQSIESDGLKNSWSRTFWYSDNHYNRFFNNFYDLIYEDYFYTLKDYRKLKLDKINENERNEIR